MGTLDIRLFGTMSIERDGLPLAQVPSRRVRDLLSYLLLGRHSTHSREHLAGIFWGDLETRRARHSFNTALWRLRRLLEHDGRSPTYLQIDSRQVGFNVGSDFRLDVAEFEHRCDWASQVEAHSSSQAAVLYRQAVELYRGDLLTDCYDDWCLVERERLRRLYLQALDNLLAFHINQRDLAEAINLAARILEVDPLREEVHRDLIGLYVESGQPATALRQYRVCETTLKRELGIEPMPETQALFRTLLPFQRTSATKTFPDVVPYSHPERDRQWSSADLANVVVALHEAHGHFERASDQLQEAAKLVRRAIDQVQREDWADELRGESLPALEQLHDTIAQIAQVAGRIRTFDVDAGP